jgi:hypothetical protein
MEPDLDKVIDRVRKLMALADSDNPNEAATAAAAAQRLIDLHRLSQTQIDQGPDPGPNYDPHKPLLRGSHLLKWKRVLLNVMARANSCATIIRTTMDKHTKEVLERAIIIIGREQDIVATRQMYECVSAVLVRSGARRRNRSSWILGAVFGVEAQMEASQKITRSEATTTALAVVDRHAMEADEFVKSNAAGKASPVRLDPDEKAYVEGFRFGSTMNLSTKVLGS